MGYDICTTMKKTPGKRKFCPKCKRRRDHTQFYWVTRKKDGYQRPHGICKECHGAAVVEYGKKNPEKRKKWVKKSVDKLIALKKELKDKPCADCKRKYPPHVMDFDHRDGKEFLISKLAGRVSRKRLLAEAAKCDVVCANCHRERTYQRRELASSD